MSHWPKHARQWSLVGPPLRPCGQDLAIVAARLAPRAVVLGVTPELVALPWPGTMIAVERDPAVIEALYPGGVAGDWRALPCGDGSIDVVVGDGCLALLPFPSGYGELARELARVLAPGGTAILRLFSAPEQRERLTDVEPGASFHALKWRLAMALGESVPVDDIRRAFDARFPDRAALAARTGWDRAVIDAIDVYRGSPAVYTFPTLARTVAAMSPLVVRETITPAYELGERCPTVILSHRI